MQMISAASGIANLTTNLPDTTGRAGAESTAQSRDTSAAPVVDARGQSAGETQDSAGTGLRQEQRVGSTAAVTEAEQQLQDAELVSQLSAIDREVRAHERAHQSAGGAVAGPVQYTYERGPDGVRYAVAGEVSIQTPVSSGDPSQDLENAQAVLRAALAPADPSAQDLQVAASARLVVAQSRVALASESAQERDEAGDTDTGDAASMVAIQGAEAERDELAVNADAAAEPAGEADPSLIEQLEQQQENRAQNAQWHEERALQWEQIGESLVEYQQHRADIQERVAELNRRLTETGVVESELPTGSLVNAQA